MAIAFLARVKKDHRWRQVTAFTGTEFTKDEWRPIPEGFDIDPEAHPELEIRPAAELDLPVTAVTPEPEPAADQVLEQLLGGEQPSAETKLDEIVGDEQPSAGRRKERRGGKAGQ